MIRAASNLKSIHKTYDIRQPKRPIRGSLAKTVRVFPKWTIWIDRSSNNLDWGEIELWFWLWFYRLNEALHILWKCILEKLPKMTSFKWTLFCSYLNISYVWVFRINSGIRWTKTESYPSFIHRYNWYGPYHRYLLQYDILYVKMIHLITFYCHFGTDTWVTAVNKILTSHLFRAPLIKIRI